MFRHCEPNGDQQDVTLVSQSDSPPLALPTELLIALTGAQNERSISPQVRQSTGTITRHRLEMIHIELCYPIPNPLGGKIHLRDSDSPKQNDEGFGVCITAFSLRLLSRAWRGS